MFPLEKRGYLRAVFLCAVGLVGLVQLGLLGLSTGAPSVGQLGFVLFLFFCGFNVLEASQPSMVSRLAPVSARGTAMGVYNSLQSLGLFTGGVVGGWLAKNTGPQGLFMACAAAMLVWLVVAWPMTAPGKLHPSPAPLAG
jgi:MFS family permease